MKALIVYDSMYGNTEKIAKSIGGAITGDVEVLRVSEADPSDLKTIDLFIVGSPTYGGRPTPAIRDFINKVPQSSLQGIKAAAFDTRLSTRMVKILGYAASKIASSLKKKGANLITEPEGFFVEGGKGPLKEGELERATAWVKGIVERKK